MTAQKARQAVQIARRLEQEPDKLDQFHRYGWLPGVGTDEDDPELYRLVERALAGQEIAPPKASTNARRDRAVEFVNAATVQPKSTQWAWRNRIPLGGVTLLVGTPGLGKSTLALDLAAQVTRGELEGDLTGEPRSVFYASAEDDHESTVLPRLIASNADVSRVEFPTVRENGGIVLLDLPEDTEAIAERAGQVGAAMLVLDPFVAFVSGRINTHRDHHIRRALAPLALLASERVLAIVAIVHLNKAQTTDVLSRVSGSGGFTAAARSVLAFGVDPDDSDRRVLVHAKSNLSSLAPSLAYGIEQRTINEGIEASCAVVFGESDVTKDDLLDSRDPEEKDARDEAAEFLRAELQGGPVSASAIKARARALGISDSTRKRAKAKLRIVSEKQGFGADGLWTWRLPAKESTKGLRQEHDPLSPLRPDREEEVSGLSGLRGSGSTSQERDSLRCEPCNRLIAHGVRGGCHDHRNSSPSEADFLATCNAEVARGSASWEAA
jgi:hypothetical protein